MYLLQLNPRTSTALYIKAGLILATLALSYYGTFFASSSVYVSNKCCCEPGPHLQNVIMVGTRFSPKAKLHLCACQALHISFSDKTLVAQVTLVSAVILGMSMAEVGVSIQHDANHGAFSTSTWAGALLVSAEWCAGNMPQADCCIDASITAAKLPRLPWD